MAGLESPVRHPGPGRRGLRGPGRATSARSSTTSRPSRSRKGPAYLLGLTDVRGRGTPTIDLRAEAGPAARRADAAHAHPGAGRAAGRPRAVAGPGRRPGDRGRSPFPSDQIEARARHRRAVALGIHPGRRAPRDRRLRGACSISARLLDQPGRRRPQPGRFRPRPRPEVARIISGATDAANGDARVETSRRLQAPDDRTAQRPEFQAAWRRSSTTTAASRCRSNKRTMLEGRLRRRMRATRIADAQRLLPLPVRRGRAGGRGRPPDRRGDHQQDRVLPRAGAFRVPGRQGAAGPGRARRQARRSRSGARPARPAPSPTPSPWCWTSSASSSAASTTRSSATDLCTEVLDAGRRRRLSRAR